MQYEPLRIYHEHQSSQLCARHCLNNLVQGPYFTEFDLSKIALDLDKEEQQLLATDGDVNNGLIEWLKTNQQSQNVSDDGNFSIQVLRRALDNLGLKIYHWGNKEISDAQQHPEKETGFICNLQAHWFGVRRIGGQWYNLNSLSGLPETKAIPTTISNFYLSAFLSTLTNDGYSIFVIRGTWPHLHSYDPHQMLPKYAKWRLADTLKSRAETYDKKLLEQVNKSRNGQHVTGMGWGNNNGNNMTQEQLLQMALQQSMMQQNNNNMGNMGNMGQMSQNQMLQQALQQSLMQQNNNNNFNNNNNMAGGGGGMMEDPELAHALQLSMQSHNNNNNNNNNNNGNSNNNNNNNHDSMDMDDEETMLAKAVAMSMAENKEDNEKKKEIEIVDEPDKNDANSCSIQLRLPQNKKVNRRFKLQHTLNDVANFVKTKDPSFKNVVFVCPPNKSYHEMDLKLETICKELCAKSMSFIVKENENKKADSTQQ